MSKPRTNALAVKRLTNDPAYLKRHYCGPYWVRIMAAETAISDRIRTIILWRLER